MKPIDAFKAFRIFGLIIAIFCWLTVQQSKAQEKNKLTKVIPPSPNAAALMKFADIPVSNYTGTPNIDIPLYTIQSGDISVPISLSYHASGIKLIEEASVVGLGWALQAGGAVSRNILDKDDFAEASSYFTASVPDIKNTPDSLLIFRESSFITHTQEGEVLDLNELFTSRDFYDFESDIFFFNFQGRSGKFNLNRQKQAVLNKQEDLEIIPNRNGLSFTITDESGFRYIFNRIEYSYLASVGINQATSWYLSEITSPTKNKVKFIYDVASAPTYTNLGITEISRTNCPGAYTSSVSNGTSLSYTVTLSRIEFTNGLVEFLYNDERDDLPNGKRLTTIKINTINNDNSLKPLKQFDFSYSYFNENSTYTSSAYKRLRLDGITEKAGDIQLPPYLFTYNEPSVAHAGLINKDSRSIDHWGYFNGVSQQGLIPAFKGIVKRTVGVDGTLKTLESVYMELPGANRNSHPELMKVFSLSSVTYPTGGKALIELEPHDFDEIESIQPVQDLEQVELVSRDTVFFISAGTTGTLDLRDKYGPNVTMNIGFVFSSSEDQSNNRDSFPYGSVYFECLGVRRDLRGDFLTCPEGVSACETEVQLNNVSSGIFNWTAVINRPPGNYSFQRIAVKVQ